MSANQNEALAEYEAFMTANPDVRYFDVMISDCCGRVRGKRVSAQEARKLYVSGVQMPTSTHLLDVVGDSNDPGGRGFEDGDPDGTLRPLPGTTRLLPWAPVPSAQVLTRMHEDDGSLSSVDPRNVAERVVAKFSELGFKVNIAFEVEFYLVDSFSDEAGHHQMRPAINAKSRLGETQVYSFSDLDDRFEFLDDIQQACEMQEIPVSVMTSEFAPSQYEINLRHVPDPLAAADHCVLLRRVIENLAVKHGLRATFMAKPFSEHSGSGMHVHLSMFDASGENVFRGDTELGSELLRHAIGGLLETVADMFAIFAPNHNAFRRFVPDQFVPVNKSWGGNNRSVAIRIPSGDDRARRLEHRIAGADANPYLVLAAILSGIHDGIQRKADPGPANSGTNASSYLEPTWPNSWESALKAFRESAMASAYLGEEYVSLYADLKRGEMEKFHGMITEREYDWYL